MTKENMNWRSTANRNDLLEKWNSPGTPAYYLLDRQGVIRRKWVGAPGEKALDGAIAKLLGESK